MQISTYIGFIESSESMLVQAYRQVAARHERDAEVRDQCRRFARFTERRLNRIEVLRNKFGKSSAREPQMVRNALFHGIRAGGLGLMRDLHDLSMLANQSLSYWVALGQGLRALHDESAQLLAAECTMRVEREISWLTTQIKDSAPQALTVPPDRLIQIAAIGKKLPSTAVLPDRPGPAIAKAVALTSVGVLGFLIGRRRAA